MIMLDTHYIITTYRSIDGELESKEINVESYDRALMLMDSFEHLNYDKVTLTNNLGEIVITYTASTEITEPVVEEVEEAQEPAVEEVEEIEELTDTEGTTDDE